MNTIIAILGIGFLSFLFTSLLPLPWFTPMIIAFIFGLAMSKLEFKPFLAGFLGVGLLWLILTLLSILRNDGILLNKMVSVILNTTKNTPILAFLIAFLTILFGSLLGGLSTLSANLILSEDKNQPNSLRGNKRGKRSGSYKLKLN